MSSTGQSSNNISTVALERELTQITNINNILQNFLSTIQKVNIDLNQICNATTNSRILMNKWTDIMSQTDFTLDAINNNSWDPRKLEHDLANNNNQYDDNDDDYEQELENQLHQLEQQNSDLSKSIETIAKEKNAKMNKRKGETIGGGFNSRRRI